MATGEVEASAAFKNDYCPNSMIFYAQGFEASHKPSASLVEKKLKGNR